MVAAGAAFFVFGAVAEAATTVETVRSRGYVRCGVTDRLPGFSLISTEGQWKGFNVDLCGALAAAVLGNRKAVEIQDFWIDALISGDVDVLHAGSTWTYSRDTTKPIEFPGTVFYDGQGFIAHKHMGAKTLSEAREKNGLRICAIAETSTAGQNIDEYIKLNNLDWNVVMVTTMDGMWRAFFGGRCDMAIQDRTALVTVLAARMEDSTNFIIFPEVISKEPLSPAVRSDDEQWINIVRWVTFAMIAAEELGVTSQNIDAMKTSQRPDIQRLVGASPGFGAGLGLDDDWAYRVIKQVGNYGEIFENNLGAQTPFRLGRGLNGLWTQGGLMIAPPLR